MNPTQKATELAKTIIETREFADFREAKRRVDRNKHLKSYIDDYIKKQGEIYSVKVPPNELQAKVTKLNQTYREMAQIPEIGEFLAASKYFNDMMCRTYRDIWYIIERNLM